MTKEDLIKELGILKQQYDSLKESYQEQILALEKKNAALKSNEEYFRIIFEKSTVGISITQSDGTIRANDAFCNMLGYTKEELEGSKWQEITYADDIDNNKKITESILSGDSSSARWEKRYIHKDGHIVWADISTVIQRDSEGRHLFFITTIQDISGRIHANELLHEREIIYHNLLDKLPDGVYKSTHAGKFVEVNPAMVDMLGYETKEELMEIDIPTQLYFEPGERESEILEEKYVEMGIYRLKKKDGSEIWVEDHGWYVLDDNRNVIFHEGIMRDVTDRKKTEEELSRQKNFFEQLFMQSSLSTQILDPEGWCERINPKLSEIFGVEPQHIEGKLYNIFKDESIIQGGVIPYLEKTFYEGKPSEWEVYFDIGLAAESQNIEVKEKKKVWYSNRAYPIFDDKGKVINVIIQHQDITDKKHAERELIEAKEHAEESDRLKSAFLANMSHEIRTPMNGILGFAELLKTPNLTGDQQQEYINMINKSGYRMLNIINDIVDISKIESGLMQVTHAEANINDQLKYIHALFMSEAESKGIELSFKNGLSDEECIIISDREKIYAILTNLVKNAVKFSNRGSIEFGYIEKGEFIEFFVKDTGLGIPQNRRKAIFDRFVQADLNDTRAFQGAGLGLSISKSYVEMLGGKIWVESEEGKGSAFYFTIPNNPAPRIKVNGQNKNLPDDAVQQIKKLKVLIVEDDETSQLLISFAIRKLCSEVIKVTTGIAAVEACRKNPDIDLVLMDLKMPIMDGYEATRKIRKFNKEVVIIAQSAFGMVDDREKAIETGCNDYIAKPLNIALLKELILKHFVI